MDPKKTITPAEAEALIAKLNGIVAVLTPEDQLMLTSVPSCFSTASDVAITALLMCINLCREAYNEPLYTIHL